MNDVQCYTRITKSDLKNNGFEINEIGEDYTPVTIEKAEGLVWFSKDETGEYYVNFFAERSHLHFFKILYEKFPDILLLDEDENMSYQYSENCDINVYAENTKQRLLGRYDNFLKMKNEPNYRDHCDILFKFGGFESCDNSKIEKPKSNSANSNFNLFE